MSFRRDVSKKEARARLFGALFAVAIAMVAFGFTFFQGFETDTANWFPDNLAVVTMVSQPSAPADYNGNGTSYYGNNDKSSINAASGTHLGRVTSAVSVPDTAGLGSCTIDTSGPGSDHSLLCFGPFTDLGLSPSFHVAAPFPSGGYTVQQDIYLDVGYANSHPDCGTASPVGAPCTPNTPGTVNPACTTDPNGIDCEGSRFTWTVGINDPSGNFHRDYVFQVGTAPDPSGSFPSSACPSGYIINFQYNSFRSGGNPYQGFGTTCLPNSGWYTFKEVFTNVGGNLNVDWSILNSPAGTVASCKDTTGATVNCTFSASNGSADSIDQIGCPRYGWLANEEINGLALDNTQLTTVGGDCNQGIQNQITPTDTTCQQFASGSAATLDQLLYTKKSGKINAVSPGVFFYYTKVSGAATDTVFISQSVKVPPLEVSPPIPIQKLQAVLYSSTCTKLGLLTVDNTTGQATGELPSTGDFIVGVKYTPSSLKGKNPPTPDPTATYIFDTELNGNLQHDATINLTPK